MYQVKIEEVEANSVLALRHQGAYDDIAYSFEQLLNLVTTKNYVGSACRVFGIYYDDPNVTSPEQLRSDACILVNQACDEEEPYHMTKTPSGPCAIVEHVGPYAEVDGIYDWIIGTWMQDSGEEPADRPCFLEYLNNPRNTAPKALRTKIYVPIKER